MPRKFIISNSGLITGNVSYHFELARGEQGVLGGGYWEVDEEKKILFLYGTSIDYRSVSLADVVMALKSKPITVRYSEYKVFYSTSKDFHQVLQEYNKNPNNVIEPLTH